MTSLVRVPDNGWELLIARLAGEIKPGLLTLLPVNELRFVTEECVDPNGTVTRTRRIMTDEERREVVESAEDYLTDAGVTPFPRGVGVYLTLPPGVADLDELTDRLTPAQYEGDLPSQQVGMMRRIIRRLYEDL